MATSFVEQATLRLNSRATETRLRSVNRLLLELDRNARKLATSLKRVPDIGTLLGGRGAGAGLNSTLRDLQRLNRELSTTSRNLQSLSRIPAVSRNPISGLMRDMERLRSTTRSTNLEFDRLWRRNVQGALTAPGRYVGYQVSAAGHDAMRRGLGAPISLDDARLRLRGAGVPEADIALRERIALQVSAKYGGMNAADIMVESIETVAKAIEHGLEDPVRKGMQNVAEGAIISFGRTNNWAQAVEEGRQREKAISLMGKVGAEAEAYRIAGEQALEAAGGDLTWSEIKRALQQSGPLKYGLTPQGLQDLALGRDEGGRMQTGEQRMFVSDMYRATLSAEKQAQQIALGLRDAQGRAIYAKEAIEEPVSFTLDRIIPILEELNVSLDDNSAVIQSLENDLGFTASGSREGARIITQREEIHAERRRARAANPMAYINQQSVRMQARAVAAQYENVMAQVLEASLPTLNKGLGSLSALLGGTAQATDYATLAAGGLIGGAALGTAAPYIAQASALHAMLDPATRPLGAAALALTGAANDLQKAAAMQVAGAGGGGGLWGTMKRVAGPVAAGLGTLWALDSYANSEAGRARIAAGGEFIANRADEAFEKGGLRVETSIMQGGTGMTELLSENIDRGSVTMLDALMKGGEATAVAMESALARGSEVFGAMAETMGQTLAAHVRGALNTPVVVKPSGLPDTGAMGMGD